jgi:hypothetical protein
MLLMSRMTFALSSSSLIGHRTIEGLRHAGHRPPRVAIRLNCRLVGSCIEMLVPVTRVCESDSPCTKNFTFIGDFSPAPVVYYTSLTCRDSQTRQDVLATLPGQVHREGQREGSTAALVAAKAVQLEQRSCSR